MTSYIHGHKLTMDYKIIFLISFMFQLEQILNQFWIWKEFDHNFYSNHYCCIGFLLLFLLVCSISASWDLRHRVPTSTRVGSNEIFHVKLYTPYLLYLLFTSLPLGKISTVHFIRKFRVLYVGFHIISRTDQKSSSVFMAF